MTHKCEAMVISPHPDDAEFGVAGTVVRWAREGRRVIYVISTNGDKGTSDRSLTPERLSEMRQEEQRAAAGVLGVSEVRFMGYPDQGLEETDAFRKHIVRLIRTYKPDKSPPPTLTGDTCGTVITVSPVKWSWTPFFLTPVTIWPTRSCWKRALNRTRLRKFYSGPPRISITAPISPILSIKSLPPFTATKARWWDSSIYPTWKNICDSAAVIMPQGEDFELGEAFHRVTLPG